MSEFARRVQTNYSAALEAMTELRTYNFLEIGTASRRDIRLTAALIELVIDDDNIDPDEEFSYLKMEKIKKPLSVTLMKYVCQLCF